MNNIKIWKLFAFFVAMMVIVAILVSAQPASAETKNVINAPDKRSCVSWREFDAVKVALPRKVLEREWEVEGLGEPHQIPFLGKVILYPRCGAVRHFPDVSYGVGYTWHEGRWLGEYLYWTSKHPNGDLSRRMLG